MGKKRGRTRESCGVRSTKKAYLEIAVSSVETGGVTPADVSGLSSTDIFRNSLNYDVHTV